MGYHHLFHVTLCIERPYDEIYTTFFFNNFLPIKSVEKYG